MTGSPAVLTKNSVELRLSKVEHAGCGEYRIETYPEAAAPEFCPGCGQKATLPLHWPVSYP